jgi:hypothetical protein
VSAAALGRLRAICLALPDVSERQSHGEPTWFWKAKKAFVTYADHHHDDRLAFWCAAPAGVQVELVADRPGIFFRPPYVGGRGWFGVRLDVSTDQWPDWDEITEIVHDAYRVVSGR